MGIWLTDAAPEAAPGQLVRGEEAATRRPRTSTSAVAAAGCFGGVIYTFLQHMTGC